MQIESYLIESHIFRRINNNIEYLILKRSGNDSYPNIWQMVTGTIDKDEKAFETALREIKEETNLIPKNFWIIPFVNSFYSKERDSICLIPVFCAEVEPESEVIISKDHSAYLWTTMESAKEKFAWHGQRQSLNIIHEYVTTRNNYLFFNKIEL
ncbi:dihydroneopterin triphosphate pyrophosphatase [bacterium BMS3Abin04]|nr:dihydroneopterin triphosphate pyrophosphatase [bacterium BMS3Abin04]